MKNIAIFLVLFSTMAFSYHEFYVSVTEVEYRETESMFQFTIKFIGHDLEKALEKKGVSELNIGTKQELKQTNEYLYNYISANFLIKCNDKILPLKMVGKELGNDDFLYCYFETEKVEKIQTIEINNKLLTEVFSNQENILHLKINGENHTISFNKEKTSQKITL